MRLVLVVKKESQRWEQIYTEKNKERNSSSLVQRNGGLAPTVSRSESGGAKWSNAGHTSVSCRRDFSSTWEHTGIANATENLVTNMPCEMELRRIFRRDSFGEREREREREDTARSRRRE